MEVSPVERCGGTQLALTVSIPVLDPVSDGRKIPNTPCQGRMLWKTQISEDLLSKEETSLFSSQVFQNWSSGTISSCTSKRLFPPCSTSFWLLYMVHSFLFFFPCYSVLTGKFQCLSIKLSMNMSAKILTSSPKNSNVCQILKCKMLLIGTHNVLSYAYCVSTKQPLAVFPNKQL